MIPYKPYLPLTTSVLDVFKALHGPAREKALASGIYPTEPLPEPTREPGQDDSEFLDTASQA